MNYISFPDIGTQVPSTAVAIHRLTDYLPLHSPTLKLGYTDDSHHGMTALITPALQDMFGVDK